MHEIVANIHMHTRHSDGSGSHADLISAAQRAGLDAIIVTDHNKLVREFEGYHGEGDKKLLVLVGEEVHDRALDPEKNHLLVLGASTEMVQFASDPQKLIDHAGKAGGLTFLAHPHDIEVPWLKADDISWVRWDVQNYTGIELWNALTEMKPLMPTKLRGAFYLFVPSLIAHGPNPRTLTKWDELLAAGRRVAAIGGSDAHAWVVSQGPIRKLAFPYEFHFRSVNTHILLSEPLSGDLATDRQAVYAALAQGSAFIGYDLPAPTRSFRFWAEADGGPVQMGLERSIGNGAILRAQLPRPAELRLLRNGKLVSHHHKTRELSFDTSKPGVYRLEAFVRYRGARRGWIYTNPIYLRA